MVTYQDFLSEKDALSFEDCSSYYQDLIKAVKQTDEECMSYWNDFVSASVNYALARSEWLLFSIEEKQSKDEARTTKHNKVIFTLKIFTSYSKQNGFEFPWLGSLEENRKQVGGFSLLRSLYIRCQCSINGGNEWLRRDK